ncbi:MAG: O-antigen ligase family protein [Candidatus Sungiibacteriota bacterium]|uniref:O-antigen ligase family protein n=1 Tax=Candidatus Sungiibacteriota bacterium TaxID=2750080 RepID=A0A7T5UR86_9BACT|nr:MAG: O-antigen ligase family protein [Candidatus Sungbacteria bacterium]
MQRNTLERTVVWVVKIGLWLLPFLPLYISSTMLFPFITGKNFAFRILVEVLFAFWVGLMVAWPKYRPRLTPLLKASTIFILIVFLADLFSPSPYRAFFSNYERMEGFMMVFHLWLYFLMLSNVFRTKKDWLVFWHSTLAASIVVGFVALMQKLGYRVSIQGGYRVDSTIGNPAYLAAYLSLNVWIIFMMLRRFWSRWWLRIVYTAALLFELIIIYFTATRGAAVAFALITPLMALAVVIFWPRLFPNRISWRPLAVAAVLVFFAIPVIFWQLRNTHLIRSNQILNRFGSISLQDTTTQARFSIWKMSLRGVLERPLFGWGQENYYLVFQKYFDPKLYSSEPWFDRSHNVVLDWLVHTGVFGFVAFFSMLGAAFWGVGRAIRRGRIDAGEGIFLGAALGSYFIQNLFVFDNLNTYLLLFAFFAYTNSLYEGEPEGRPSSIPNPNYGLAMGGAALLLVLLLFYPLHFKPIRQAQALISALRLSYSNGNAVQIRTAFEQALSYQSFGTTEVREQLGTFARGVPNIQRFTEDEQRGFVNFAVEELKKEILKPSRDAKHMIFIASILNQAARLNPAYVDEAVTIMREAIRLAPAKQIFYFELAQAYILRKEYDQAIEVLRQAVQLEPNYGKATGNLFVVGALAGRADIMNEAFGKINLKTAGEETLNTVGKIYRNSGAYEQARKVYEQLVEISPEKASYHATLAALLGELGEYELAKKEIGQTVALDPAAGEEARVFLEMLKQKMR